MGSVGNGVSVGSVENGVGVGSVENGGRIQKRLKTFKMIKILSEKIQILN